MSTTVHQIMLLAKNMHDLLEFSTHCRVNYYDSQGCHVIDIEKNVNRRLSDVVSRDTSHIVVQIESI